MTILKSALCNNIKLSLILKYILIMFNNALKYTHSDVLTSIHSTNGTKLQLHHYK